MVNERIRSLIEQRTIMAARKEVAKKLYTIVKAYGKPVIEQSVPYNSLPNYWELDAPELSEIGEEDISLRGYYFDGLRSGVNLCIKMTIYDGRAVEVQCDYNGYMVFSEENGVVKAYAPFDTWENAVDKLYTNAKPVETRKIQEEKEKQKEVDKKKVLTIMEKLRLLWGI
jgi:hypothetical protein